MAEGGDPDTNPFLLLPSDIRGIENAAEYVKTREKELKELSKKVKQMWWFPGLFWDSKIAKSFSKKRKWYHFMSFSFSDPKEIEKEIKTCLKLLTDLLQAVDKVDDEVKTEPEREMPLLIIINLHEELFKFFEVARNQVGVTTSKTVARMYEEYLGRREEIENKIKSMEIVFMKQQCLALFGRHESLKNNTEKAERKAMTHKEQELNNLKDEMKHLKEENKTLNKRVEKYDRRMDELMRRLEDLEIKCKKCKKSIENCVCP